MKKLCAEKTESVKFITAQKKFLKKDEVDLNVINSLKNPDVGLSIDRLVRYAIKECLRYSRHRLDCYTALFRQNPTSQNFKIVQDKGKRKRPHIC